MDDEQDLGPCCARRAHTNRCNEAQMSDAVGRTNGEPNSGALSLGCMRLDDDPKAKDLYVAGGRPAAVCQG